MLKPSGFLSTCSFSDRHCENWLLALNKAFISFSVLPEEKPGGFAGESSRFKWMITATRHGQAAVLSPKPYKNTRSLASTNSCVINDRDDEDADDMREMERGNTKVRDMKDVKLGPLPK